MFIAIILLFLYFFILSFIIKESIRKESIYPLLYIILFLPTYSFFQILIYDLSQNIFFVNLIKYSKDLSILFIFFIYLFGKKTSIFKINWKITRLDLLFISFSALIFFFMVSPVGEANLLEKIIYGKNLLLISLVYFLGRNINYSFLDLNFINKTLVILTSLSCLIALIEFSFNTHLHSTINYSSFYLDLYNINPTGNYGLSWTFERPGPIKRFGSFFADPLEFSSFLLIGLSIVLFKIHSSKISINRIYYFIFFVLIITGIYLSYSRSVIISVFLMFFINLILIKKYRLLLSLISISFLIGVGTYYYSSEETKYFILDTITFQNSSSLGHLVKWIQGILSITENPLGSGLGSSGNSLSVDDQISIGGENQFIIIGVQMGLLGLINYIGLIYYSIRNSYKLFNLEKDFQLKYLPFIVCCLKFSLIFPLMTSNAEIYTFLSLFGWFIVGLNERRYDHLKLNT